MKKIKIRYKRLIVFLFVFSLLCLICFKILNMKITNIYVDGNIYLTDYDVIEISKLQDYPRTFFTTTYSIKSKLESNLMIASASVKKKELTKVYIDIVENRPLFYDETNKKTVLKNGDSVSLKYNVPILTSNVSSSVYKKFLEKFSLIELSVFNSISEVSYMPNDVDKELFLFSMNDGNYVYVNLDKFESINKYFEMSTKFNNHKGILYLDSGEYFKILDN